MPAKVQENPVTIKYPAQHAALNEAVSKAGGQTALANAITALIKPNSEDEKPVKQGHVHKWLTRDHRCSPAHVLKVEKVTGVSRHRLRPDLYPKEETAA